MSNAVMVLTRKSLARIFREGGTGDWVANAVRIRKCSYVIAVRNGNSEGAEDTIAHGTGFVIGRGLGVVPDGDRIVITFAEYAVINVPDLWAMKYRNPVIYADAEEILGRTELSALDWKPFPTELIETPAPKPLTLSEAKLGLAAFLKIDPSAIEINIRG